MHQANERDQSGTACGLNTNAVHSACIPLASGRVSGVPFLELLALFLRAFEYGTNGNLLYPPLYVLPFVRRVIC